MNVQGSNAWRSRVQKYATFKSLENEFN